MTDTGSGIPAEYLPLIFQRHFRVPGDAAPGGSGLGLAIVREIVTAHGGAVECESSPGKRTVFRMSLPTTPDVERYLESRIPRSSCKQLRSASAPIRALKP